MKVSSAALDEIQEEISKLDDRYVLDKVIGAGSYGVVIRARDTKDDNKFVAIKRVNEDIFEEVTLAKRILREIKLLAHFHDQNIIGLRKILVPRTVKEFKRIYIVMDIMDTDLKQVLRSGQVLSEAHTQFFIYQTLRALHVIHSAGVIHRDVTPANLLVNTNCDLKICDFGLAKEENDRGEFMTDYVTMRWYRAPELVMEDVDYSTKIDVWGVGCILGELLGSRPLFQGKDRVNQLDKIIDVIGTPSENDFCMGSAAARAYLRRRTHRAPIDWREKYPNASAEALDLLKRILVFNPKERLSVTECMRHPFLESIYDQDDEATCAPFVFDDKVDATLDDVKEEILLMESYFRADSSTEMGKRGRSVSSTSRTNGPSVEAHGKDRSALQTFNERTTEEEKE
ncbi:unnamed protein product [Phytomonas sp. EM1]|nr:unnamed protein product [Phytomonas sp. EM1]|eukprot:CCW63142.1 unnamed protein product [Phytomonas sp. isolate EM1]